MRNTGLLRLAVFCLAGVLGFAGRAHADTIVNFTFVNVEPGPLVGTVDIDTTTGQWEAIQATFSYGYNTTFSGLPLFPGTEGAWTAPFGPFTALLYLNVEAASLTGFTGGNLSTAYADSLNSASYFFIEPQSTPPTAGGDLYFYSGSLVPTAPLSAVPEPSTWVLTATALLGGLGGLSRRGRRCAAVLNFRRTSGG